MKVRKLLKAYLKMRRKARFLTQEIIKAQSNLFKTKNRFAKLQERFTNAIAHNVALAKENDNLYERLKEIQNES